MKAKQILFTSPGKMKLRTTEFSTQNLKNNEVAIKTEYSIVSAGTELAILAGLEDWAPLPFVPGYGSVGKVISIGSSVKDIDIGDRVFTYGKHTSYGKTAVLTKKIPDRLDSLKAVVTRMAAVSITANRVASAELGDYVAVFGLGLVGNLSAQLFKLAGCEVIGIDILPNRLAVAKQCGIKHVLNPNREDQVKYISQLTKQEMCSTVVEASGIPAVAEHAIQVTNKLADFILLGSPRQTYQTNLTDFLNYSHLISRGSITIKGAHEWRFHPKKDPSGLYKHSIERNIDILFRLIEQGQLIIEPLITHITPPEDCETVYQGLKDDKDTYIGVIFDWKENS